MIRSRVAHPAVPAIVAMCAVACAVACADARVERVRQRQIAPPPAPFSAPEATGSVIPTAPVRDECFGVDTSEASAMTCAAGAASRIADTMQILLSNGRVVRRVDVPSDDENRVVFRYSGRIGGSSGGPAYHVLDISGYESTATELINAQTGDSLIVMQRPRISPDGARIVVDDMTGLSIGEGDVVLQIWRITDDKPVREFNLEPYDYGSGRGWGPSKVEWRSADTITFLRTSVPRDSARRTHTEWDTTRSILVYKPAGWVLDPRH